MPLWVQHQLTPDQPAPPGTRLESRREFGVNVLGDFIREQMKARGWVYTNGRLAGEVIQLELVRRSGIPKQVVSALLNNQQPKRMIGESTIRGLAVAFGLDHTDYHTAAERDEILRQWERAIRLKALEAIGIPAGEVVQIPRPMTEDEVVALVRAGFRALQSEAAPVTNQPVGNDADLYSGESYTTGDPRSPSHQSRRSDDEAAPPRGEVSRLAG